MMRKVQQPEFPSWPYCSSEEQQAAMRVLRSGQLNYWTGQEGKRFEEEFGDFVGCDFAVAVANGTVGLELALAALEIGPGDEVLVPSRTFIATASAVIARGATPICTDVDHNSQNITVEAMEARITPCTRAVIVVHLAGWPCEMRAILEYAAKRNLRVIEDCAQAHGAKFDGHHVGSMGEIGVFSFCQDKIMTTAGEGGMIVTSDRDLWKRAWSIKDHGKDFDEVHRSNHARGFRWLHKRFGTNWRMTEVQSAIGRVVLRKMPSWVEARRRNAAKLNECFLQIPALRTPLPGSQEYHSYYKCYTFIRPELIRCGWNRDRIMEEISAMGVPCFSGSCSEIYLEEAFREIRPRERQPIARELGRTSLMFLVHPTLEDQHIEIACRAIKEVFGRATDCSSLTSSSEAA